MQHKHAQLTKQLIMCLFAPVLVGIGWYGWVMAHASVGRNDRFLGWFFVIVSVGELGWLFWFYAKRWLKVL